MRINNIVKLSLESRAKELRGEGKSLEEIASILSSEAGQMVTRSSVYRYFASNDKAAAQVIEKTDKLKAKLIETEINTINQRLGIINSLIKTAEKAYEDGDSRAAVLAYRAATEAQDSLDKRLGKLKAPATNINVFNIQEAAISAREKLTSGIASIAARSGEIRDSEQFN